LGETSALLTKTFQQVDGGSFFVGLVEVKFWASQSLRNGARHRPKGSII